MNMKRDRLFTVTLVGEGSCDSGGPMRDVLTNIVEDLMSTEVLPLFIPTANNLASVDPFIDCFRMNPNITEPHLLQKIKFTGYFFGWSIKAMGNLNLYLPSAFWNRVVKGGADYEYTMEDLKSMDLFRYNTLKQL